MVARGHRKVSRPVAWPARANGRSPMPYPACGWSFVAGPDDRTGRRTAQTARRPSRLPLPSVNAPAGEAAEPAGRRVDPAGDSGCGRGSLWWLGLTALPDLLGHIGHEDGSRRGRAGIVRFRCARSRTFLSDPSRPSPPPTEQRRRRPMRRFDGRSGPRFAIGEQWQHNSGIAPDTAETIGGPRRGICAEPPGRGTGFARARLLVQ